MTRVIQTIWRYLFCGFVIRFCFTNISQLLPGIYFNVFSVLLFCFHIKSRVDANEPLPKHTLISLRMVMYITLFTVHSRAYTVLFQSVIRLKENCRLVEAIKYEPRVGDSRILKTLHDVTKRKVNYGSSKENSISTLPMKSTLLSQVFLKQFPNSAQQNLPVLLHNPTS